MPDRLFCNQKITSSIPFPELPEAADGLGCISILLQNPQPQDGNFTWVYDWETSSGETGLSYAKSKDGHILRFPSFADFIITTSNDLIAATPTPETPIETIRHLLLDQVLPRLLAQRGMVMVHASAVSVPNGAILFIGPTGKGKSTLAGYFHLAGNAAISDDCVQILMKQDRVNVIPSYSGLRLWADTREALFPTFQEPVPMAHYSSKQRVNFPNGTEYTLEPSVPNPLPVLAVIILSPVCTPLKRQKIELTKLSRREVFIEMMKQSFRLDVSDRTRLTHLMQQVSTITSKVNSYRLNLAHDYDALPQVRQLILDQIVPTG